RRPAGVLDSRRTRHARRGRGQGLPRPLRSGRAGRRLVQLRPLRRPLHRPGQRQAAPGRRHGPPGRGSAGLAAGRPRRPLRPLAAPLVLAAAPAPPPPVVVKIANFTFAAPMVTVAPGTTVTWVNEDDIPHTIVAADNKAFRSKVLDSGDRFAFTFTTPGTWGYYCGVHPHMTGKVVVKAS